ncbi:MAG: phosphate/phosphite/phosphonate ABC transporter substrate-binding protein [Sulfuricurvum sp.]|uniref:phosphate/phosphite/phosphonate ABC transporter substrate-binding protein n=1 Tax=Sulfuricurvum sp. TaxID=2025608 RepID=UPI00262D8675|nr:phosphate/phosphite/phosphonate ABC transporter substrate-binding protein [Sulfuricurvum sp.]MDD2828517.1 phosphate/phosphite/phosphonate ABC transporter substrate-binding protein [Sulfuricurvum sp.]MDD4948952.1 phosphate/phosphite/phosphonate ABC transporter substrate-binding protein [Sulfuricurvum sp.]
MKYGIVKLIFFLFPMFFIFSGCMLEDHEANEYKPTTMPTQKYELIVGIHPYLNTQKTFLAYEPIIRYLEKNIPLAHFTLETSLDYGDYERKLYAGHFDLALPNPLQTLESTKHGYRIVAKMKPDSVFRGVIVSRKENHIHSVEQLRHKPISFPASTALAATLMPKMFLYEKGLNVDKDAMPRYVGSQYSSIMNAYSKDTIAAATWPTPWITWQKENPQKAQEMELIWETPSLVNNGFVIRSNIDHNLSEKIVTLLCALDTSAEGKKLLKDAGFDGFEKASAKTYIPVEAFLKQYDRTLGLPK